MTLQNLGEIGPDVFQINRLFILNAAGLDIGWFQIDQCLPVVHRCPWFCGNSVDDAGVGCLDHKLHFHGFKHRHRVADGDGISWCHIDTDNRA